MRRSLTLLTLLGLAVAMTAPLAARADVIDGTYDFTMTQTSAGSLQGDQSGTGSFTISGAGISQDGYTYFSGTDLTSLNFSFTSNGSDGAVSFALANAQNNDSVVAFDDLGDVVEIGYYGDHNQTALFTGSPIVNPTPPPYYLDLGYGITYGDSDPAGVINVDNTPISPIPEPSTLALFGSGLLGLAFTLRRKLKLQKDTPSWDGLVA